MYYKKCPYCSSFTDEDEKKCPACGGSSFTDEHISYEKLITEIREKTICSSQVWTKNPSSISAALKAPLL